MAVIRLSIVTDIDVESFIRALQEPEDLFADHPSIVSLRAYRNVGVYELRIRLRKFLGSSIESIHFTIKISGDSVYYESLEPGKLRASYRARRELDKTIVEAVIEYELEQKGAAIDETMKSIFRTALKRAEDKARTIKITAEIKEDTRQPSTYQPIETIEPPVSKVKVDKKGETKSEQITCETCLLYEKELSICAYLAKKIENPEKPLCGGEKYIRT